MPGKLEIDIVARRLKNVTQNIITNFRSAGKTVEADLEKSIERGGKKWVNGLKGAIGQLATVIGSAVIVRGFQRLSTGIITLAGNLEQARISFKTMLGSAEEADRLLRELADFAQSTPFELTGVRQNAKQLLAMGVSTKDLLPTLKSLGDVSAGLSIPLERLALNYGQVISQGKLTGRELRDFTVAGVPILAELARMLGKTNAQIQEMISDGAISADIVVQAFKNMSSEGGKFANLMEAQSQTLQGSRSNLRDATDQLGEVIGTIFIPALTAITKAIIPMVDSARAWVNENPKLAKGIGIVVTALVALIGVLGAVLPVLAVMKVSIATLGLTLGAFAWPIGRVILWVTALTAWVYALNKSLDKSNPVVKKAKKETKKLGKEIEKLRKQYRRWTITSAQYEKQLANLTAQQESANLVVEGGSEDVADYRGEMDELARTAYETHSAEFQEERTEIIKNIKAIKEYKSQLLQAQITELEGAKERQKIDSQQDYGQSGFIATMSDFDVRTLTSDIEYTKKEIAEADDNLINFDKNIENLREEILATEKPVEDFSADLGGVGGGAKKAKDGVEELEDAIDDLEDQTKDMEKANEDYLETSEDLKDANHKFYKAIKDDLRDVGDAIEDVNEKYKTTVDDIIDRRSKLFGNNASNFARSQAEGETKTKEDILDLEEKLSELQHERIDEEDEEKKREKILENAEKQLEIEQEITEEKAKLLRIQENLNTLNQQLVDEERDRAGLSDEERALGDFENTQKEVARNAQAELLKAEQARDAELKKLEQKKRILEVFQNHELTSVKQLNDLLENEKILALDTDMFRLLERLALERIELIQLNDKKKGLADDLYSYTTQLENNFYNTVSGNVDRLTAKYRTLVETIRSAIAEQNIQNNQSRASGRVDGWPVTAGQSYLVGENPDGSPNATTELFVPGQSGSIVNAQKVQEALREAGALPGTSSVDNSRNFTNEGPINFTDGFDFELRLERNRFRS